MAAQINHNMKGLQVSGDFVTALVEGLRRIAYGSLQMIKDLGLSIKGYSLNSLKGGYIGDYLGEYYMAYLKGY